jgi:hypothetical protein
VAGEASHVLFAVPEGAIDSPHHNDHSASSHLLNLCVGRAVFHVAIGAGSFIQKAQRLNEGLHRGRQVGSLEYLDVFPATSTTSSTSSKSTTSATASGRGSAWAGCSTSAIRGLGLNRKRSAQEENYETKRSHWAYYMQTSPFAKLLAGLFCGRRKPPSCEVQVAQDQSLK